MEKTQISNAVTEIFQHKELDIGKGLFTLEELSKAVMSTHNSKACGFDQIPSEVWKLEDFRETLLDQGIQSKSLPATLIFIDSSKAFDSIHRGKMKEILIAYGVPVETVNAIMMLYRNTRSIVRSPDGDSQFFDITAGVLQGDTLAPLLFIICLDYVLRKALDKNTQLGLTLVKRKSTRHPAQKITDVDYADDLAVISDHLQDAEKLFHLIEIAAEEVGLYVNASKTEYICLNEDQSAGLKSIKDEDIKRVSDFKYLGSYIASTEKDVKVRLAKAWTALNGMNKIWKSTLPDKLKRNFFRATVESVLVYGATTWTLTKTLEKQLNGAYTRMLRAALNKPWQDHPTRNELYGDLPLLSDTIRQQSLRFAGHCWLNKSELAADLLLWNPSHGKRQGGRPKQTYIDDRGHQLQHKRVTKRHDQP